MRWLVSVALAIGLVGGLFFSSSFVLTHAALLARTHGPDERSGFAFADPPSAPEPKRFEQPIPVQVAEPFCAPWITVEPDGSATACGEPVWLPPTFEAPSI